jgi:Na+/H+ antiporter NhaD/arsenite permease-like protein
LKAGYASQPTALTAALATALTPQLSVVTVAVAAIAAAIVAAVAYWLKQHGNMCMCSTEWPIAALSISCYVCVFTKRERERERAITSSIDRVTAAAIGALKLLTTVAAQRRLRRIHCSKHGK